MCYTGSVEKVYKYLSCAKGPENNYDYSFLTLLSFPGLKFGIINIVGKYDPAMTPKVAEQ
jgi:hypothetical protein